jgi:hypothetical protein
LHYFRRDKKNPAADYDSDNDGSSMGCAQFAEKTAAGGVSVRHRTRKDFNRKGRKDNAKGAKETPGFLLRA